MHRRVSLLLPLACVLSCSPADGARFDSLGALSSLPDTLVVGYGGWAPYTEKPSGQLGNMAPTGIAVDVVNEIVRRTSPRVHIRWEFYNFKNLDAAIGPNGSIDFLADPVFVTTARAQQYLFSRPWAYFGLAVGLVRKGDRRFATIADVDRKGVKVLLLRNWTSTDFAARTFKYATLDSSWMDDNGDPSQQFKAIEDGLGDIALNDAPSVEGYANAHSTTVEALWLDAPPSLVAGGFVVPRRKPHVLQFLNGALEELFADGTIASVVAKRGDRARVPVPYTGLPQVR